MPDLSDNLFDLALKHELREKVDDEELIELLEGGQARLTEAIETYNNQFEHLLVNLSKAFNERETNLAVLTRRYSGIKQRLSAIDQAQFAMRSAYADIWEALETALTDAPLKALSQKGRLGAMGKLQKNPVAAATATAMAKIRQEWVRQHRPGGKFATEQARKYQQDGVSITEGGIRNAISRWRKEDSGNK